MAQTNYEAELGNITLNIAHLTKAELQLSKYGVGKGKIIIEDDFSGKVSKYRTNEVLRDYIDDVLNSVNPTLYLDANEERLNIGTKSAQSALRVAVELNSLLNYSVTADELEEFRRLNSIFSRESNHTDDDVIHLMAGMIDFNICFESGKFQNFSVVGDLLDLYSDLDGHEDIEEEIKFVLCESSNYNDLDFASESGCFFTYATSKEALIELVVCMNELAGLFYTENDKELLSVKIDSALKNNE